MDQYIAKMKPEILEYLKAAKATAAKIEEGRKLYQPDAMEREEKRLRDELADMRATTEKKLDAIRDQAYEAAKEWGRLDGSKLTPDIELLKGDGVSPQQFNELVHKYHDNATMLDRLKRYGERMNAEAVRKARADGDADIMTGTEYNVYNIETGETRQAAADSMRKRAGYFLDVADGANMDNFALSFARSTADALFESWGTDPLESRRDINVHETLTKTWGFDRKRQ